MISVRLTLAIAALAVGATTAAAALCERPEEPSCASWFEQFASRYDLDSCQRDLETFKSKVTKYADCVKKDAEQLGKDVKKAAEDFQRRAAKGVSGQ
jgi:hypothetical protein